MSQVQVTLTFASAALAASFLQAAGPALGNAEVSTAPVVAPVQAAAATSMFTAPAAAAPAASGLFGAQPGATAAPQPMDFKRDVYPRLEAFAKANEAKFAQLMQGWGAPNVAALETLGEAVWRQHILPALV